MFVDGIVLSNLIPGIGWKKGMCTMVSIYLYIMRKCILIGVMWGVVSSGLHEAVYSNGTRGVELAALVARLPAYLAGLVATVMHTCGIQVIPEVVMTALTVTSGFALGLVLGVCAGSFLRLVLRLVAHK